jgi:CDGSH-type Zn-finger protein/uncharacterized Fe-S cluster protein YjdI
MGRSREYEGDGIVVSFEAERCIHAAECVGGLPAVFNPDSRPWISPDGASPEDVARVVSRCPTGALSFERRDGGPAEAPPPSNSLRVGADGPVFATGRLVILDAERRELCRETRVALCRCGASGNKPYCDGAHKAAGFRDPGTVETAHVKPAEREGGPDLTIRLRADGPLVLEGPFALSGSDGSAVRGAAAALCRCGASRNKPFCDGSHRHIDFSPDDPSAG